MLRMKLSLIALGLFLFAVTSAFAQGSGGRASCPGLLDINAAMARIRAVHPNENSPGLYSQTDLVFAQIDGTTPLARLILQYRFASQVTQLRLAKAAINKSYIFSNDCKKIVITQPDEAMEFEIDLAQSNEKKLSLIPIDLEGLSGIDIFLENEALTIQSDIVLSEPALLCGAGRQTIFNFSQRLHFDRGVRETVKPSIEDLPSILNPLRGRITQDDMRAGCRTDAAPIKRTGGSCRGCNHEPEDEESDSGSRTIEGI